MDIKNNQFGFHRETPDSGIGEMSDFDLTKFLFDNSQVDWESIVQVPMDEETVLQPSIFTPQPQQLSGSMPTPQQSTEGMVNPQQSTGRSMPTIPQSIENTVDIKGSSNIILTHQVKSGPSNVPKSSLPPLRTSSKQELQRRKALEDSRREQQVKSNSTHPPPQSTPVDLPPTLPCSPQTNNIPREVLQVRTRLENPTRYHIAQCMVDNATRYAMENGVQKGGSVPPPMTYAGGGVGMEQSSNQLRLFGLPPQPGSAPPNIFAPEPRTSLPPQSINSSLGTSVTSGCSADLNDPIATLDVDSTELNMLTLSEINELISQEEVDPACSYSTTSNNFMSSPQTPGTGAHSTIQPSTPMQSPGTPEGYVRAAKDRQKKDNHNKIERRRRYLINDMINLQGLQLPKPTEPYYDKFGDVKQNKGAILQASVDYIQLLKDENEEFRHKDAKTQQKLQQTEVDKKKLLLRIQELEQLCIRNGIAIPEEALTWRSQPDKISNLINGPITPIIKQEPKFPDLMDEGNIMVTGVGDPMLGPGDFEDVCMELS